MVYLILTLLAIIAVPISLFVGLWSNNALVAITLPFVPLLATIYFGAKAEEAASRDF